VLVVGDDDIVVDKAVDRDVQGRDEATHRGRRQRRASILSVFLRIPSPDGLATPANNTRA
jgi:hypothetical protein